MRSRFVADVARIGLLVAAYFLAAKIGLQAAFVAEQVSAVWPPTGIALAALRLGGYRLWPGIAIGAFLANVTANETVAVAGGIALGNTLESLAAAWLLERFIGFHNALDRVRDVFGLVFLAAGLSTMIAATIGATCLCLGGMQPWSAYASIWSVWWLGDAMGILVVAPVLLTWASGLDRAWSRSAISECVATLGVALVVGRVVFASHIPSLSVAYPYMIFPLVVWAALRCGQVGTTAVVLQVSVMAVVETLQGFGPFVRPSENESLVLLQSFMAVVAVTSLILAATTSERALAEERLRASDERARFTLDAARVGTWEWDIRSGQVRWSDNMEAIHGLPPGRFTGTFESFLANVDPDDRELVITSIQRALADGQAYHVEYRQISTGGPVTWFEGKGRVVSDEFGRPVRLVGVCTAITDRKRAELALIEADRRKDEFLATLSHELRNPLAPISNAMQFLHMAGPLDPQLKHAVEIIERQVRQMTRLVEELLDVSRITRNKLELRKERIDLATVIESSTETSRPAIEEQHHELVIELPNEPIPLEGDLTRLSQIFSNLLNNAAKFTEPGGRIVVRATREGDEVAVAVEDNGVGIPAEKLSEVFEMFAQVNPDNRGARGGLGIGLALVKRLVDLHGGRIEAQSGGGRGSRFVVYLPVAPTRTEESQPAHADRHNGTPLNLRILVVDDNHDSADSLAILLRAMGSNVVTAHDGLEAVSMAESIRPQVVLLDIGMPRLNGYEAARRIRSHDWGRQMMLVALTGWGQEEDRGRSRDAGFDRHVTKPVDVSVLRGLLECCANGSLSAGKRT